MFAVILIGVVLSSIVRFILFRFLGFINFDGIAERAGVSRVLERGGVKSTPSAIVSSISYWGILLVFFMMGFVALDIVPINNLISEFFSYIPSIVAATVILILGFVLGNFIERGVMVAAGNAGIGQADLIGKGIKFFIIAMTAFMALEQLGIAKGIIIAAFSISFGGIVFALSLAFGLGAQDLAGEFLKKRMQKAKEEKDESESVQGE